MTPSGGKCHHLAGLVRPYARTTGRTRPAQHLPLEALVQTRDTGPTSERVANRDQRAICRLCRTPTSVAEVAAGLCVPLGVAQVLIADAVDLGLVIVHGPPPARGDRPSLAVMERVLHGLRQL